MSADVIATPILLTARDVAGLLGVSPARVYQMVAEQRVPHVRFGRAIRIPRRAFETWLEGLADADLAGVEGEP